MLGYDGLYQPILILVFTVVLACCAIWGFTRLSANFGLLDAPCKRKSHTGHIPLVGGLAIYVSILVASFYCTCSTVSLSWLLGLSGALLIIGVIDDRMHLSSLSRFAVQIAISLIMVYGAGNVLTSFGDIGLNGTVVLGIMAVPLTVFATVGVINAMNMIDGLDGLSAGLAFIAFSFIALMMYQAGQVDTAMFLLVVLAAIFGFLLFNARWFGRKRAAVFLGDAGSTFLGFMLAWFVISSSQGEVRVMAPVTALWFIALPLFDTVGVMLRRVLKGHSPFKPDHHHLHHIFLRAGYRSKQTVMILHVLAIIFAMIGYTAERIGVPENIMFFLFLGLFALYFVVMMNAWKVMKFLRADANIVIESE